jgi:hypothetical protein
VEDASLCMINKSSSSKSELSFALIRSSFLTYQCRGCINHMLVVSPLCIQPAPIGSLLVNFLSSVLDVLNTRHISVNGTASSGISCCISDLIRLDATRIIWITSKSNGIRSEITLRPSACYTH